MIRIFTKVVKWGLLLVFLLPVAQSMMGSSWLLIGGIITLLLALRHRRKLQRTGRKTTGVWNLR
jgi:hypothetical protein